MVCFKYVHNEMWKKKSFSIGWLLRYLCVMLSLSSRPILVICEVVHNLEYDRHLLRLSRRGNVSHKTRSIATQHPFPINFPIPFHFHIIRSQIASIELSEKNWKIQLAIRNVFFPSNSINPARVQSTKREEIPNLWLTK